MANNSQQSNKRQAALRNRKRQEGLKPVMLWLPTGDIAQLQRMKRLRDLRSIDNAVSSLCEIASGMSDSDLTTNNKKGA